MTVGHQFYFYMTPEDTILVQDQLKQQIPMKILHSRSPTRDPLIVDSLNHVEDGKQILSLFLSREEDLAKMVMSYVGVLDYWTIDALRSPVIEFTCCFFDNKVLRRGRAFYVDGYHEQGQGWIEKDEQFKSWAKVVLDAIRTPLKRYMTDYIGPGAQSWLEKSGGKLTQ